MIDKVINIILVFILGWMTKRKDPGVKELKKAVKVRKATQKELKKLLMLVVLVSLSACASKRSTYCSIDSPIRLSNPWVLSQEDQLSLGDHNKMWYCLCDKNKSKELNCYKGDH